MSVFSFSSSSNVRDSAAVRRELSAADASIDAWLEGVSAPLDVVALDSATLVAAVVDGSEWDLSGGSIGLDGSEVSRGFVVGGVCDSLVLDAAECVAGIPAGVLAGWLAAADESGALADSDVLGWWLDEVTGLVHVDLSTVVHSRGGALALGASRGELAIWDCAAFDEVRVSGAVASV